MAWKDWLVGEVVTEADFQSLIQDQVVQVYLNSTVRDTTLGANVADGMVAYLTTDDALQVYNGSAWVNVSNPGDITAVTAGTGLSGGGTSGDVTLSADLTAIGSGITITASQISDVTATAAELNFVDGVTSSIQAQLDNPTTILVTDATTARTLTASDAGKTILFTSASAITVTVNASTDFPAGQRVDIIQDGAGVVTVTAATATVAGAGVSTTSGSFTIGDQFSAATILGLGSDAYRIIGNISAV